MAVSREIPPQHIHHRRTALFLVAVTLWFVSPQPSVSGTKPIPPDRFPTPVFEHIATSEGLPENSALSMMQDHLGFIWFGTRSGLVKYDGYSMTVYRNEPGDPQSLTKGEVMALFEDASGTMWVGTIFDEESGLNRFDRGTEKFTRFVHDPDDSTSLSARNVYCVYEDSRERLWVGSDSSLNLLDRKTNRFTHYYYSYGRGLSPWMLERLSALDSTGRVIASLSRAGNNADLSRSFALEDSQSVICVIMGEELADFGWIENQRGDKVLQFDNDRSVHAGGWAANRVQVERVMLPAGTYRARYVSDGGHAFNQWLAPPPTLPQLWGIQVFADTGEWDSLAQVRDGAPFQRPSSWTWVLGVAEDRVTGDLLVGGWPGVWRVDEANRVMTQIQTSAGKRITNIKSFHQSEDGTIWMASSRGLLRLDPITRETTTYQVVPSEGYIRENELRSGIVEMDSLIWCGNFRGALLCFDPRSEQFKAYEGDADDPSTMSGRLGQVRSLMKDRTGILWVGTLGLGVNKWDPRWERFRVYRHVPGRSGGLGHNWVTTLCEDREGNLWVGTAGGGIDMMAAKDGHISHFRNNPDDPNSISSDVIMHILEDPSSPGLLWISTQDSGLVRFDFRRNIFKRYVSDPNNESGLNSNALVTSFADGDSILWVCASDGMGINRLDRRTGGVEHLQAQRGGQIIGRYNYPEFLYRDRQGSIWLSARFGSGLYRYEAARKEFLYYETVKQGQPACFFEDHNDNFWVGTYTTGLYLFDRATGTVVRSFTAKDGLADDQVVSILEDDSGNLWIGTHNGISKLNPETGAMRSYHQEDGLSGNFFYPRSAVKRRTGEMVFGSSNGLTAFFPNSVTNDTIPPAVVITNASLFNRPNESLGFNGSPSEVNDISVGHDQNDLRFGYVGLHFGEPERIRYLYMLENFDETWVDAGTERSATYTNLDPGEYTFKVKAANRDGVWSIVPAALHIVISPPFWRTWWAYSVYVIALGAAFQGVRRYDLKRSGLKHQVELDEALLKEREETDRMKSRFFANISHEFRTPLTLILGPIRKWHERAHEREEAADLEMADRNARRLLRLINQLLDLSRLEAGGMKLRAAPGNIVPFVKGIAHSFSSSAGKRHIRLCVQSSSDEIELYFDRDKMEKILTNLLSNAFKFTSDGGAVNIGIRSPSSNGRNLLDMVIADDGIGIARKELPLVFDRFYQVDASQTRAHEGSGIGLALTKELVELHGGTIVVRSEIGKGAEFTLTFPLGRDHLKPDEVVSSQEPGSPQIAYMPGLEDESPSVPETGKAEIETGSLPLVLIVEDNADVREYMKGYLVPRYQVIEAADGSEGIEQAKETIPDLIISDVMMPKIDGYELCRILKRDEKTSHIPIILLTARVETGDRIDGLETGADDYLTKPFEARELLARVKNLIELRQTLRSKFEKGKPLRPGDIVVTSLDDQFLRKVIAVVEEHMSDEAFSVEAMAIEVGMSRAQLHRKLKALTSLPAGDFIRYLRLQRARDLIEKNAGTIGEIAYLVGFGSPSYFAECFHEQFGVLPSEARAGSHQGKSAAFGSRPADDA